MMHTKAPSSIPSIKCSTDVKVTVKVLGWGWQFPAQSSKHTAAQSGSKTIPRAARCFSSCYRNLQRKPRCYRRRLRKLGTLFYLPYPEGAVISNGMDDLQIHTWYTADLAQCLVI